MAIFNSIALGKSSGSIGNVTTARLKGQGVAKSRITQTTNVNSPGQVESRGKMSNIVLAWQFLAIFLVSISALRKSTESNYNAFVRGFKSEINDVVAISRSLAAAMLSGLSGLAGNFITVVHVGFSTGTESLSFLTGGLPFSAGTMVRVIAFDAISGESTIVERAVTNVEWLAGELDVTSLLASCSHVGAYIFNTSDKKCSNIMISAI